MTILSTVLTVLLWVVCTLIVAMVLLQTGKGGGMAGVFGGGAGPESLLGTRAASFLVKVTVVLCLIFLTICLTLGRFGRRSLGRSKYESTASEVVEEPIGLKESGGEQETGETGGADEASKDEAENPDGEG